MLAAFCQLRDAQRVKKELLAKNALHFDYMPVKELGSIYFPLTRKVRVAGVKVVDTTFSFPEKQRKETLEDLLKGKLTPAEFTKIPRTQEIVGSILILEIPEELESKEELIAAAYLKISPHIETVVKKTAIHSGQFRTRKVKVLAGKRSKETLYHENGIKLHLNIEKVYFSARLANERMRIARMIAPQEKVLVMFSGCGPYPMVLAKHSDASLIVGVELNPQGHIYASKNVMLNKFEGRIILQNADVREALPKMRRKFDRILLPLPKTSEEFLNVALPRAKIGGMIHLYAFLHVDGIDPNARKIKKLCKDIGYKVKIVRKVKCGQHAPRVFRVCYDITVQEKV